MLEGARLVANLRATDLERAIAFYEGTLGLTLSGQRELLPGHREALFEVGGAVICIEEAGSVSRGGTPVAFEVDDLDRVAHDLRTRGVALEEYDLPGLKTVEGIATIGLLRAAWVEDPDGTLLGFISPVRLEQER